MSQDNIELIDVSSFPSVVIRDVVSTMKLGRMMGPAYHTLKSYLAERNVTFGDGDYPFCIYRGVTYDHLDRKGLMATLRMMFIEKWNVEVGLPTPILLEGSPSVTAAEFPGGKYLQTVHMGAYRNLRDTYKRMADYAATRKITLGTTSVERYTNSPGNAAEADLRTIVLVAVQ